MNLKDNPNRDNKITAEHYVEKKMVKIQNIISESLRKMNEIVNENSKSDSA
ncbi:hypothetical protein J2S21_004507 [Peribacillus cavernae]|nr:hypothetical protein [Peribacillus cavernae]